MVGRAVTATRASEDVQRAGYFRWLANHPHAAEDPSAIWAAAWQAGAWDAIRRNASLGLNLSQIVQRLEELAALYADHEIEADFEEDPPF